MTQASTSTIPGAGFIRSRKHARTLPGPALAMLAGLGLAPAFLAQAHADEPAGEVSVVRVTGTQQAQASSNPKFTAPLLDTPKSVTVVPAEVISQTAATSLTDALRTVPGITIGAGEGGNPVGDNLFIRGYNAQSDTFVDGIRDAGSQSREIFDVEQVEVVKGPNSALGGRASAGGGVNLVKKTAQPYDINNASVGFGSDHYRRVTADLNRTLGHDAAFRLNLLGHEADAAGRTVVGGNRWGIAPTLTLGLGGPTEAILNYYHLSTHETPDTGIPFNNPLTSGNLAKNGNGTPFAVARSTFYGLLDRDFRDTRNDTGTVDVHHRFRGLGGIEKGRLELRNVTRFGKSHNDYVWTQPDDSKGNTALYGTVWRRANTRTTSTQTATNVTSLSGELRTGRIKHSFDAGVEFDRETTDRAPYVFLPGTYNSLTGSTSCPSAGAATLYNCTSLLDPNPDDPWVGTRSESPAHTHVVTRTRAAYAFDTIEFTPRWLLNLGLRRDNFSSRLDTAAAPAIGSAAASAAVHASVDSSFTSEQAGLVYKPSKKGSIYLSYATSATPPGNDAGDGQDALNAAVQNLQPQRSRSVELGSKWDLLPGGRLSLTGAVFRSTMDNARVTAPDGTSQNIGRKEVKGAELGFSGKLGKRWTVFGGYTFLDAVVADNGYLNVGTTAAPVYVPSPYDGNRFPSTPRHSATLWTTYAIDKAWTVGLGASAMDRVYATVNNNKYVAGYARLDAMASWVLNPKVTLQLNLQNLTDRFYFDRVSSPHYAGVAPGRSATLAANFKF